MSFAYFFYILCRLKLCKKRNWRVDYLGELLEKVDQIQQEKQEEEEKPLDAPKAPNLLENQIHQENEKDKEKLKGEPKAESQAQEVEQEAACCVASTRRRASLDSWGMN